MICSFVYIAENKSGRLQSADSGKLQNQLPGNVSNHKFNLSLWQT